MTALLHLTIYGGLALLGWFALVLAIGVLIRGRSWAWECTRETTARLVFRFQRRRRALAASRPLDPPGNPALHRG